MTVECKCHALSTEELTLETSCCSLNSAAINLPLLKVTIEDILTIAIVLQYIWILRYYCNSVGTIAIVLR